MGMEAKWRLRIMAKVGVEIMENGGLKREEEGKETRKESRRNREGRVVFL
jgi:hypothetical protein